MVKAPQDAAGREVHQEGSTDPACGSSARWRRCMVAMTSPGATFREVATGSVLSRTAERRRRGAGGPGGPAVRAAAKRCLVQNVTVCQVSPPFPVSSSCPGMSP